MVGTQPPVSETGLPQKEKLPSSSAYNSDTNFFKEMNNRNKKLHHFLYIFSAVLRAAWPEARLQQLSQPMQSLGKRILFTRLRDFPGIPLRHCDRRCSRVGWARRWGSLLKVGVQHSVQPPWLVL